MNSLSLQKEFQTYRKYKTSMLEGMQYDVELSFTKGMINICLLNNNDTFFIKMRKIMTLFTILS